MNAYWYCLATKILACIGFVALVIFDHPWLGLLCFSLVATIDGKLE